MLGIYPFVEKWVTGDTREHHLLDRPRNNPVRTGHRAWPASPPTPCFLFAAGNDIMAIKLGMSINDITWFFRIGLFVLPPIAFWVTKRICLSLQRRDRDTVLHGRETGTIVRTPDGKFFERHEAEVAADQWLLVQHEPVAPIQIEADVDENGVARKTKRSHRLRGRLSRFYFADAVNPVTPAELAAAHHHGAEHEAIEPSASGGAAPIEAAERRRDRVRGARGPALTGRAPLACRAPTRGRGTRHLRTGDHRSSAPHLRTVRPMVEAPRESRGQGWRGAG